MRTCVLPLSCVCVCVGGALSLSLSLSLSVCVCVCVCMWVCVLPVQLCGPATSSSNMPLYSLRLHRWRARVLLCVTGVVVHRELPKLRLPSCFVVKRALWWSWWVWLLWLAMLLACGCCHTAPFIMLVSCCCCVTRPAGGYPVPFHHGPSEGSKDGRCPTG